MIDEKKLIKDIKNNIHIVSTRSNGKTIFADFLKKFIENIIKIIEAQPKISLENKTSDNMNSSCSGQVWIPCEGCKDCKHNINGCCMSIEDLTECNEGLLKLIKEFKNETNR